MVNIVCPTTDEALIVAGTAWGEARGCGAAGMQNVTQCILNRRTYGWSPTLTGVCLAPYQFSCWLASDPNSKLIVNAIEGRVHGVDWDEAVDIAHKAIQGLNPDRILGADSYYACSMHVPPSWARYPAHRTYSDGWHNFWLVRPADQNAYNVSHHAPVH